MSTKLLSREILVFTVIRVSSFSLNDHDESFSFNTHNLIHYISFSKYFKYTEINNEITLPYSVYTTKRGER